MSGAYAYRGGWDAIAALLRAQGARGLFKGYWLTNSVRARPWRCTRAGCRGPERQPSSPDRCAHVGAHVAGAAWSVHVLPLPAWRRCGARQLLPQLLPCLRQHRNSYDPPSVHQSAQQRNAMPRRPPQQSAPCGLCIHYADASGVDTVEHAVRGRV